MQEGARDRPWNGELGTEGPLYPCQRPASFKRGHGLCLEGGLLGSQAPRPQDLPLSPRKGRMRSTRVSHICQQRRAEGVGVPASKPLPMAMARKCCYYPRWGSFTQVSPTIKTRDTGESTNLDATPHTGSELALSLQPHLVGVHATPVPGITTMGGPGRSEGGGLPFLLSKDIFTWRNIC